ncbi:hypothetical protein PG988_013778 [Apiospora saccharicola]
MSRQTPLEYIRPVPVASSNCTRGGIPIPTSKSRSSTGTDRAKTYSRSTKSRRPPLVAPGDGAKGLEGRGALHGERSAAKEGQPPADAVGAEPVALVVPPWAEVGVLPRPCGARPRQPGLEAGSIPQCG